jgi:hypothetical protein
MLCKFNVYKLTSPLPQTTGTTLESGHLDPAGQMVQVVKPVVFAHIYNSWKSGILKQMIIISIVFNNVKM